MFAIDFSSAELETALEKEIESAVEEAAKLVADDAPDEMRRLMPEGGVSTAGAPPRRRTGNLAESIQGKLAGVNAVEFSMIDYGGYLDPLFEGFKGAGWADRPFIETGIDRVLERL